MLLRIVGDSFSENVTREIEAITNHSTLHYREVAFDKARQCVTIPITRLRIVRIRKRLFGLLVSPQYDRQSPVRAAITIGNVVECEIEKNIGDSDPQEVHAMFGLSVNMASKRMYLTSVEEDQGKKCYSIDLVVSDIDIQISDSK